jgi:hypothetical protein
MPKYIDYHEKMPQFPPNVLQEVRDSILAGKRDQFGVKLINGFVATNGEGWCLCEADSPDAVCKSHEAKGMRLDKGDVHEVKTMV